MRQQYLDISLPITEQTVVWPGDPGVAIAGAGGEVGGVRYRASRIALGSHTGTHVDTPLHLGVGDTSVDQLPLEALIGPAQVHDLTGHHVIGSRELEAAGVGSAPRALLRTDNSRWVSVGPVPAVPAHVSEDGARYLVRAGVRLVGIDALSLDHPQRVDAHLVLLRAGVVIVEMLDLSQVTPGEYELICLPLRLAGGDGAPARAVLQPRHRRLSHEEASCDNCTGV